MLAVERVRPLLPAENLVVSGLWFHSHCRPIDVRKSAPAGEATVTVVSELEYELPQAPLTS